MSFTTLVQITNGLMAKYPASTAWNTSKFNWIRGLPPASKGAIGRDIGAGLLQSYGFTPSSYRYELRVNGQAVLVRVAMKWEGNVVKFQNIRDTNFQHVLCIALYPAGAYAWLIPKKEIWQNGTVRLGQKGITPQHKGADAWISIDPNDVPSWLAQYGGTIDQMVSVANKEL